MHKLNDQGSLVVPLILTSTLLVFSLVFGLWAFAGMQDYKNNTDQKIAEAVTIAKEQQAIELRAQFDEDEKQPFRTYTGPAAFGTLKITYPKTWSVYVNEKGTGSRPIEGYMHPLKVMAVDRENIYAFRFEVAESSYDQVMRGFESSRRSGKVTVEAYRAPKVESVLGSRIRGEIENRKQGDMVVLPLRDKTIKIWTEGESYRGDFDTILTEFSFVP